MKFSSEKLIVKIAQIIQSISRWLSPFFGLKAIYFFADLTYILLKSTRLKKEIIKNIEKVFPGKYSKEAKARLAKDLLKKICCSVLEIVSVPFLKKDQLNSIFKVQGLDHLESALSRKKGVLILSLHTSNSESIQIGLRNLGYRTNMIVRDPLGNKIFEFLRKCRESKGTHLINVEDKNLFQEAFGILKSGEILGIAVDTGALEGKNLIINFLGHSVPVSVGWKIIAQRSGAPVVTALTTRSGQKNKVILKKGIIIPKAKEGEKEALNQIMKIFEKYIEEDPSRWNMFLSTYEVERMLKGGGV